MISSTVSERPVSLSAGCVRAILAGKKLQLRYPVEEPSAGCPLGQPGDRLWVREPWAWADGDARAVIHQSTGAALPPGAAWQPPKELPREHSRVLLEMERLRLEHLQDIPDRDLPEEGLLWREDPQLAGVDAREGFARWWDSLHPRAGTRWDDNPWVWAVRFRVVPPQD